MRYTDSWWDGYADCMNDIIKAAKHLLVPKSMREALNTENNPEENTLPCPDGHGVSGQAEIREEFETLWNLYPKKKGDKQSAYKSYQDSRKKGEITFDFVKDKIEQYCESIKAEKTESRYIAYGSTWFHQKRWNDDYSVILTREPTLKDVMPAIDVSNFFNKG